MPFVDSPEKIEAIRATSTQPRRPKGDGRSSSARSSKTMSETSWAARPTRWCSTCSRCSSQPLEVELRRQELACGRALARHREQPRVLRAHRGDQLRAGARRRRTTTRDLAKAQVILVGVSRCGKTPTTLYLALQFGIRAANFPLTPDDFADSKLPASLLPYRDRLFGLTIKPERLRQIRGERRPGSPYATLDNCRYEVREAEQLMQRLSRSPCSTRRRSRSRKSPRRSCIAAGLNGMCTEGGCHSDLVDTAVAGSVA